MTNFWPHGLELSDTQSPMDILNVAQANWESESKGLLTLVLQTAESKSGYDMIIVHAKHVPSNRTASLFSVVCRPGAPYPARIEPRDDTVPDFLKKSYYQPPVNFMPSLVLKTEGQTVQNYWVADTPSEFRGKLQEVFNLGIVKSEVLSLAVFNSVSDESEHSENGSIECNPGSPPEVGGQDAE
jgi:hypothetical protein